MLIEFITHQYFPMLISKRKNLKHFYLFADDISRLIKLYWIFSHVVKLNIKQVQSDTNYRL
jgi:hypothetical protein